MGAEPIRAQSAVALGGGHGLHASLHALRRLVDDLVVDDLSAIVTVADNGGSSGRLRGEFAEAEESYRQASVGEGSHSIC